MLTLRVGLLEAGDAGREAVNIVLAADGAEFPLGEEAGHGELAEDLLDRAGVVMRFVEKASSATVATEEQGGTRRRGLFGSMLIQQVDEIFVGGVGVSNVELDCLSRSNEIANRDRSDLLVRADHVGDQEIPATK